MTRAAVFFVAGVLSCTATDNLVGGMPSNTAGGAGRAELEIVTTNDAIVSSVSVLLGTGNGTFGPKQNYPSGTSPTSPLLRDLNGDGFLDLVIVNYGSNTVSVLLGTGAG